MEIKNVVCPKCRQDMRMKLEQGSDLMIVACKSCGSFMMYYMGETFEVDEVEMRDMASSKMKEVSGFLQVDPPEVSGHKTFNGEKLHGIGAPIRNEPFSLSDISDLKIELESSTDCLDFINGL